MMKVVIIEDEELAAERLGQLIAQYNATIEIVAVFDCIEESTKWFAENPAPDLAFFDIQLADGLSFEIFEKVKVGCPVIFTTAYNEYALRAFKVNSIDYLLKPIDLPDLKAAFTQFEQLQLNVSSPPVAHDLSVLQQVVEMMKTKSYKSRFIVKSGTQLSSVPVEDIHCFFSEQKVVWMVKNQGKKHMVDYTLEQLEPLLSPKLFFRLNRKYIAHINAIAGVTTYSNSRLKVNLEGAKTEEPIIVSRERVSAFKAWLDQ